MVLASWMFMQYLLTNEVQISYAQTEGYIPVTYKAQNDPSYLDYLSRSGEDTDLYYDVKIDATKLVIDNIDNTFVTPVYNGSADLRNAAGELVEQVVRGARTSKEKIDGDYIDTVFTKVADLYHLRQMTDGPLPVESVLLICVIPTVWVGLAGCFIFDRIKKRRLKK